MPRLLKPSLTPCLFFPGNGLAGRYALNATVAWGAAADVTMEAWCQLNAWVPNVGGAATVMSSSTDMFSVNGGRGIYFLRAAADLMQLVAYAQGTAVRAVSISPAQKWSQTKLHVVASFSNTNGIKISVNGELAAAPAAACTSTLGTTYFIVGNSGLGLPAPWCGLVGGIRVWTRELAAAEVRAAYQNQPVSPTSLLIDVPCTDGAGTLATDRSGNGNHLTLESPVNMWYQHGIWRPRTKAVLSQGSDLPGCAVDLDASREVAFVNNDPAGSITNWADATNPATAAGSARPTYKTNQRNSLPVFEYDGAANVSTLVGASVGVLKDYTCFIVFKTVALGAALNTGGVFGNTTLGQCQLTHYQGDSNLYWTTGGAGANYTNFSRAISTWTLLTLAWDGTITDPHSLIGRAEGVQVMRRLSTAAPSSVINYQIGRHGAGNFWNGQIGQIIVYRRRLQDTATMKVEEMLAIKWGF